MKQLTTLFNTISDLIHHSSFINLFKSNQHDFSRDRFWTFPTLFTFILKKNNRTMKADIHHFFNTILDSDRMPSKASLSKARDKLLPDAFLALNSFVTKFFFQTIVDNHSIEYHTFAIDGSTSTPANTPELQEYFGTQGNQFCEVTKARVSACLETSNELFVDVIIDHYSRDERSYVKEHLTSIISLGFQPNKSIILFDRGYQSHNLIDLLEENGFKYLFRLRKNYTVEVNNANKEDQVITYVYKRKTYKQRVICVKLETGETEKLVTNLFDINCKEFKEMYFKRWKIETGFNTIKNSLKLDCYSGSKPIIIYQDFYATFCLYNLMKVIEYIVNQQLEKQMKDKQVKHKYEMNYHYILIKFKDMMIKLFLKRSKWLMVRMMNKAVSEALRDSEARQIKKEFRPAKKGSTRENKVRVTAQAYYINKKTVF